jgi:Ni,Fe-hydrogenase I small subunit
MKLIWLSAHACNGNVHSFFNYENLEKFLEDFSFIYHPSIDSAYTLKDLDTQNLPCDVLLIEGTLEDGLKKGGFDFKNLLLKYGEKAKRIITVGTCASFGGIFLNNDPKRYGLHFRGKKAHDKFVAFKEKTINVSGCPIHPQILANTLYSIKKEYQIKLDPYLRPKEFFAFTTHNGCLRNEYFEYKVDNYEFGNIEGCMFYEHGCQGPFTNSSCNKILWNEVSSKTRSGHPCVGCTEPTFPKENLYKTKTHMGIPAHLPLGVPKRAYIGFAGVAKAFKIERFEKKII